MLQTQPTTRRPIEDGLDRNNISELRKRFLQLNFDRLLRTRNELDHRQVIFFDVLPLLFHCNHPMLPGFVSHATPAGVAGYKPSKKDVLSGKSLARSFRLAGGYQGENVWGIYTMGSVGTLAHNTHSDFDVWLCLSPELSEAGCQELKQKCLRISQWAKSLRLEVHFFLMNSEAFSRGKTLSLDEESSGSAQQSLLLDEFYRTALYLAGRLPVWWFVPSDQEPVYEPFSAQLLDKRFLRPGATLDFGGLNRISPGEYVGAGAWQLYKAIESPYKSVLKLLLMESYAADFPDTVPLAMEFKQQVYSGELNVDQLDPYLCVYRRIESYLLGRNEPARLELVRRCFYYKVRKPLSQKPSRIGKPWQRVVMETLVEQWGWSEEWVANLDRRPQWKAQAVQEERSALVQSLNASYDGLQAFANKTGVARTISQQELHILGRKLQAAFERRPDKIDWINPGISKDISESHLRFVQTAIASKQQPQGQKIWQLYGARNISDEPLRQSNSPVDMLLWCYVNRVIDGHVQFDLALAPQATEIQMRRTLTRIQQWLPLPLPSLGQDAFAQTSVPKRAMILINVAKEPVSRLSGLGVQRLSGKNDPLQYGSFSENLVASIDLITLNSWNELGSERFEGDDALLSAMQAYMALCMPGSHQAPPELTIDCLGIDHAAGITKRIRQWFQELAGCYYTGIKPPSTRYVFELSSDIVTLQFRGPKLHLQAHKNIDALMVFLSAPQKKYSPVVVDSYALINHPLKILTKHLSAANLLVFYERRGAILKITLVDEKGSLIQFDSEYTEQLHTLNALFIFLRSVLLRMPQAQLHRTSTQGEVPVQFHELKEGSQRRLSVTPRAVAPVMDNLSYVGFTARLYLSEQGGLAYDFECLGQVFSWEQLKDDVFFASAQFMLSQRREARQYRIYITDLDISATEGYFGAFDSLQSSHYMTVKLDIEHRLMAAARALSVSPDGGN